MIRYLLAFIIGATLWRLGGWKGKWIRRYLLPFIAVISNKIEKSKLRKLLLFAMMVASFSLGYGEKRPYWYKFLVGCSWVVPKLIFLGFSWFAVIVPFVWIILFWLSNHKPYSNVFKWHVVEVLIGGCVGMAYV